MNIYIEYKYIETMAKRIRSITVCELFEITQEILRIKMSKNG